MNIGFARIGTLTLALLLAYSSLVLSKEPEEIWRELNNLTGEERQRVLLSKAREEGEVSWYSSVAPDAIDQWRRDFESRYPGIKVRVWRGRGEAMSGRMLTEARAGKLAVDVGSGAPEYFPILRKADVVGQYFSPEREFYPATSKDRDGFWTNGSNVLTVIGYNGDLVPRAEAPKGYEDFLHPKWRGRFAIDTNPDTLVMGWLKLWGNETTEQFLKALMQNGASVRSGHSLIAQLLCAGEFTAAIEIYAHRAAELREKGCPLEMVFPDPTIGSMGSLFVAKRAPHPFAAALLVDYLLSIDGQKILLDHRHHSSRQGMMMNDPELDLKNRGVTTLLLAPDDMSQIEERYFQFKKKYLRAR